jgi:hypothetical protein
MRANVAVGVLVLALCGCAAAPAGPDAPKEVTGQNIAPYAAHEECRALAPGDRLDYRFSSSSPVAFNIHYHDGKAVVMPLVREGVTADSGIFQPGTAQEYCLMWEAGGAPVLVSYRIAVRRRGAPP